MDPSGREHWILSEHSRLVSQLSLTDLVIEKICGGIQFFDLVLDAAFERGGNPLHVQPSSFQLIIVTYLLSLLSRRKNRQGIYRTGLYDPVLIA